MRPREQWAKLDVDTPTDEKLFNRPVVERHLWTCLICYAKKLKIETGDSTIHDSAPASLAKRFNITPTAAIKKALDYFASARPRPMIERHADGSIFLINFQRRQDRGAEPVSSPSGQRNGYVYFVRSKTSGMIKIGFSANPWARLTALQAGSPDEIELAGTIKGVYEDERKLHDQFAADRAAGEWFRPSAALLLVVSAATQKGKHLKNTATSTDTTNDDGSATSDSYPVATKVAATSKEVEVDQEGEDVSSKHNSTPVGSSAAAWDPGLLDRLRAAVGATEFTDSEFADFLRSPNVLCFPQEQREAAVEKFLAQGHASTGKRFGYLVTMIRGGAKPVAAQPASVARNPNAAEETRKRIAAERAEAEKNKAKKLKPFEAPKAINGAAEHES